MNEKISIKSSNCIIYTTNGNKRKLIIADNPETLEIINTTSQTMTTNMPVIKSIPNIAPNDVATPLPPLNFKNIESMWPIMIARANRHSIEFTAPYIFKINIGRNPLIRSKKNVRKPAILFPLLITFVAPGLLEPNDLGSGKEKIFEITTANGIDPIK